MNMRPSCGYLVLGLALCARSAQAELVDYQLVDMTGNWAWGNTQWNASHELGYVDNESDIAVVNTILRGPYAWQPAGGPANGIYNWHDWLEESTSLTFAIAGGALADIGTISVLSSRSYSPATRVTIDYSADSGATWKNALQSTTGELDWIDIGTGGSTTELIHLGTGAARGNQFRLAFFGEQVSLHSVMFHDTFQVPVVPEPSAPAMLLAGVGTLAFLARRRASRMPRVARVGTFPLHVALVGAN